jgi:hypothetical protein
MRSLCPVPPVEATLSTMNGSFELSPNPGDEVAATGSGHPTPVHFSD